MAALPGRTYQFFTLTPRYYFGDGLSYTTFAYSALTLQIAADDSIAGQVTVANVGQRDGAETIQVYAAYDEKFAGLDVAPELSVPRRVLVAFDKRHIQAGQAINVSFAVPIERLTAFGRWLQPSLINYRLSSPTDTRRTQLSTAEARAEIDRMRARREQLELQSQSGEQSHPRQSASVTVPVWISVGGRQPTVDRISAGLVLVQRVNVTGPVDDIDVEQNRDEATTMEA